MNKIRKIKGLVATFVFMFLAFSMVTTPVAATFSGSATPNYDYAYTSAPDFEESSASTNGECEILVVNLDWPWAYPDNTVGIAYVAVEVVPSEDVTNNWDLTANFDIDYELGAAWWGTIELDVVFCVRDSDKNRIWPYPSEFHREVDCSGIGWEYTSGSLTDQTETAGWGIDLDQGETYYFCIELRITVVDGGAVVAHADSSSSDPVLLIVNSISWGYP